MAQEVEVRGLISNPDGEPLIGASIAVVGSTKGTISDENGHFKLIISPDVRLMVSMIGHESQVIEVGNVREFTIVLVPGIDLNEVAIVGSRNSLRVATETPVPVDILDVKAIAKQAPQIGLSEILNYVVPSFSSNKQTISDGTDHVDPASLRGMGPDHVLVLVNGKRRHSSSLVNINGTVGRGSVGTDLNAIPVSAIERIEVLRDGAAAQYGSDAIAGVINIVLKTIPRGLEVGYTTGANYTALAADPDGQKNQLTASLGLPLGKSGGSVHVSGDVHLREATDRTGDFEGQIFNRYNTVERLALADGRDIGQLSDPDLLFYAQRLGFVDSTQVLDDGFTALQSFLNDDVTDEELIARELTRSDFNMRTGQSKMREAKAMYMLQLPVGEKMEVYSFGGLSYRAGNSGGFYRLPYQSRTYTPLYINGFIPEINSHIIDQSLVAGLRGELMGWKVDISHAYGRNSFDYLIGNTNNASMLSGTPISFAAGGHAFSQNTTNLDVSQYWDKVLSGLHVAWGLEHRLEHFVISAGEEASYVSYDINGDVLQANTPDSLVVKDYFGNTRPGGAQVFPGFSPANELSRFRNSFAAYGDMELDISKRFLVNTAFRFENYSDFGGSFTYKIAARYLLGDKIMVRAAHSTGFRAPSLHQLYFNRVSTQFIGGIPYEIGTFTNDSKVAKLLGIPSLKQERALNYSGGLTWRMPIQGLTLTLDGYYVKLNDRVTYTGAFKSDGSESDAELAGILKQVGASSATFFANSIDAVTKGVDFVLNYHTKTGPWAFKTSLSGTFSSTKQVGLIHASPLLSNKLSTYFSEYDRVFLEEASPRTKMHLSCQINYQKFSLLLRESYFGKITHASHVVDDQQVLSPKFLTDASLTYQMGNALWISVGADNLFDTYPDLINQANADYSSGRFPYSRRSTQFGFAGRFLFVRINWALSQ